MALGTITLVKRSAQGGVRENVYDIVLDSSYPTNGSPLTFQQVGFTKAPLNVDFEDQPATAACRTFWYDRVNQKLLCYVTAGTEVPNATNLSTVTARVKVTSIS